MVVSGTWTQVTGAPPPRPPATMDSTSRSTTSASPTDHQPAERCVGPLHLEGQRATRWRTRRTGRSRAPRTRTPTCSTGSATSTSATVDPTRVRPRSSPTDLKATYKKPFRATRRPRRRRGSAVSPRSGCIYEFTNDAQAGRHRSPTTSSAATATGWEVFLATRGGQRGHRDLRPVRRDLRLHRVARARLTARGSDGSPPRHRDRARPRLGGRLRLGVAVRAAGLCGRRRLDDAVGVALPVRGRA